MTLPQESTQRPLKATLILEAAQKRFAQYGYTKVTMDEVAEDLGVVKGSIYYYFPTKESLFKEVLKDEMKRFIAELQLLPGTGLSSSELVRSYVEKRQYYFHQVVNLGQLDYSAWVKIKPNFQDIFHECEKVEIDFLESIFTQGQQSGEFCNVQPGGAMLFLHLMQGLRMRVLRESPGAGIDKSGQTNLDREITAFVEVFLCSMKHNSTKHTA